MTVPSTAHGHRPERHVPAGPLRNDPNAIAHRLAVEV